MRAINQTCNPPLPKAGLAAHTIRVVSAEPVTTAWPSAGRRAA
jgi:hypothetical protein